MYTIPGVQDHAILFTASPSRQRVLGPRLQSKVTRRDFFRDVDDTAKRYGYSQLAERVFYLCPTGLVSTDELPVGCGLIEEDADGSFRVVIEPPSRKTRLKSHLKRLL